jgi:hypothetical protein
MAVLSAALAFAITMLTLSMVASVFVETLHRFIGLREKGLRIMIGHVYDRVIKPYIDKQGGDADGLRDAFMDLMTVNRAPAGQAKGSPNAAAFDFTSDSGSNERGLLSWIWGGRRLARLGPNEFMSRLGGSEFGDHVSEAIRSAGLADPDLALKDIAGRFEEFGRESSVFFERRARLISVLAAIAVAWLMYVHPYELIRTYLDKPEVAEAVIAMQDKIMNQYEIQVEAEAKTAAEAAKKDTEADAKLEAKPDDKSLQAESEAAQRELEEAIAARDRAIAAMNEARQALVSAGVPVGWDDQRLAQAGFFEDKTFGLPWPDFSKPSWFRTTLWLLLGGLLVGLGGPFWYDAVKSLSSLRTVLGGAKGLAIAAEGSEEKAGGDGTTKQPRTPVENYHAARAGREAEVVIESEDEAAVG